VFELPNPVTKAESNPSTLEYLLRHGIPDAKTIPPISQAWQDVHWALSARRAMRPITLTISRSSMSPQQCLRNDLFKVWFTKNGVRYVVVTL
jgi:hypothetical protein